MKFIQDINTFNDDPGQLENLYQTARKAGEAAEFKTDLLECHTSAPDNVLYSAWYYRLQTPVEETRHGVNWKLAVPLSFLTGLLLWLLSDGKLTYNLGNPQLAVIVLLATPLVALIVIAFLTLTAKQNYRRAILVAAGLTALTAYAMVAAIPGDHAPYREQMALHLPLMAYLTVGISLIGFRSQASDRFAFLAKSIEVVVTGGVYAIAVVIFIAATQAVFGTLDIYPSDIITRLMTAGGLGLLPVFVVATLYDPTLPPSGQDFSRGLSRMISVLPRLLLPLTLLVLVIYIFTILFNFMTPFYQRDVLITYNAILFAIMGLLVGVTPMRADDLSERFQKLLRWGIILLAILVILVSLYALSAIIYRTVIGGWTSNRIMVIGWNIINTAILGLLLYKQFRLGKANWVEALHQTFGTTAVAYLVWGLFLVLVLPWIF